MKIYYQKRKKIKPPATKEIRLLIRVKLSFHAKYLNSWTAEWEKESLQSGCETRTYKVSSRQILSTKGLVNKTRHNHLPSVELLGVPFPISYTKHLSLTPLFSNVWKSFPITEVSFALSGKETNVEVVAD